MSDRVIAVVNFNDIKMKEIIDELIKKNGLVPVIRCKDCDSWDEEYSSGRKSLGNYRCICHEWSDEEDGHYRYTAEDDFCSYAERREK